MEWVMAGDRRSLPLGRVVELMLSAYKCLADM